MKLIREDDEKKGTRRDKKQKKMRVKEPNKTPQTNDRKCKQKIRADEKARHRLIN